MAKFVCPVCGYVHEGDTPPEFCPICKVPGSKFTKVEGELKLAAEHVFGIGTKLDNVPEEDKKYILEQLKANFTGECSEVGMYLCMARVAAREGYPEIALYWEKAAFEEAEHAAKFAELLGSELEPKMTASTKENLKWRVDCEYGATQGKFDLAACRPRNGPRRGPSRQGPGRPAEAVLRLINKNCSEDRSCHSRHRVSADLRFHHRDHAFEARQ